MRIIGITGGIGSGKSTAARVAYDLGARIIDADLIAKRVMKKGNQAYYEVIEEFGTDILNKRGGIDRKKLAQKVFTDSEKRKKLNKITHKYIAGVIHKKIERMKEAKSPDIVVIDAPIPIEEGFLDVADEVWVVNADKEKRIDRIIKRNNVSQEEALNRINSQMEDQEYKKIADVVIENNGTVEELEKRIARLFIQKKTR